MTAIKVPNLPNPRQTLLKKQLQVSAEKKICQLKFGPHLKVLTSLALGGAEQGFQYDSELGATRQNTHSCTIVFSWSTSTRGLSSGPGAYSQSARSLSLGLQTTQAKAKRRLAEVRCKLFSSVAKKHELEDSMGCCSEFTGEHGKVQDTVYL